MAEQGFDYEADVLISLFYGHFLDRACSYFSEICEETPPAHLELTKQRKKPDKYTIKDNSH